MNLLTAGRSAAVILFASFTAMSSTAQNTTLYVDASVTTSGDGSQAAPFLTLQEAVAVPGLVQGDEILLAAGEYIGNFTTGNYKIIGVEGPERTILRSVVPGVTVTSNNTWFVGVTFAGTPGVLTGGVWAPEFMEVFLQHCIVRDHEGNGATNDYTAGFNFCTFVRNRRAIDSSGAGLLTIETVSECIFQDNLLPPFCLGICVHDHVIEETDAFVPGFWDADGNDFRLRPGSPAIDVLTYAGIQDLGALPFEPAHLPASAGADFCFGDGGDGMGCTPCPCMNDAPAGTIGGCVNGDGRSARLLSTGTPSFADDTLRFDVVGASTNTFGILASAATQAPANPMNSCFGSGGGITSPLFDGLRCIVQNVQRHGTRPTDTNGDIGLTGSSWGPPSNPMGGLINSFGGQIGQARHFYVVYRADLNTSCGTGFNTTQATTITVTP